MTARGAAPDGETVPLAVWLAVIGANLGAFMAVLNIQIVNASLADIQGAIGAGIDQGGWVSTSYLVAEIITIPLTGWLSRVFSLRRYLIGNAVLFLVFSVACAFAHNLEQMIALRALQGFFGGVLIPMAFTIIITLLPKAKQPVGLALFAVTATFAPAIGPTVGGYLSDTYGWQFVFYVNLVPGAVMIPLLWSSLEKTPMRLDLLREGDWTGIVTMALGLGCLQTLLEEGNKNDWFGSPYIVKLAVVAAIALPLFIAIEFLKKKPLLDLRLLARRNFALGTGAFFLLGIALYGSIFIMPLYLSQMQGYNAQQIGEVLAWYGLPQLVLIPFVPRLMRRFDARRIVAVGFVLFAASNFMNVHLDPNVSGPQFILPNIVRAVGQALLMTPLSAIAIAGIEAAAAGSASALVNMMRNLGGAVGIAWLETFLTQREHFHSSVLSGQVSLFAEATRERLAALQHYFLSHGTPDAAAAWHQAVIAVGQIVRRQSFIMAYGDAFFVLGAALALATVTILFLKRPERIAAGGH